MDRILLQPTLTTLADLSFQAVITVMNTHDVTIENLAIDASNDEAGCDINEASNTGVSGNIFLPPAKRSALARTGSGVRSW